MSLTKSNIPADRRGEESQSPDHIFSRSSYPQSLLRYRRYPGTADSQIKSTSVARLGAITAFVCMSNDQGDFPLEKILSFLPKI